MKNSPGQRTYALFRPPAGAAVTEVAPIFDTVSQVAVAVLLCSTSLFVYSFVPGWSAFEREPNAQSGISQEWSGDTLAPWRAFNRIADALD